MEFLLIGLPPFIMVTDFKRESPSIPYMAAKLDTAAATTSFSQDFFHNVYKKNTAPECIQ